METERIPATEDPDFHIKLGPGAMSDIEWVAQLLQLRHGHDIEVRSPSTLEALDGLRRAGHLASDDAAALRRAYRFFARVRNRLYLQAGRPHDSLPVDQQQAAALARSLGYIENPRTKLREDYRRHARRTRRIIDRVFYGQG